MIPVKKEDVMPHIYFVSSFAQDGVMYGGLSGKSDYIGGIFDRWVNTIPESVIFNKHLLPKVYPDRQVEVVSDFWKYNPKVSGVAPDVFGIKIDGEIFVFVKYDNGWSVVNGAPEIEVKAYKKPQYMVNLRDQNYTGYLVMVETDWAFDYLLPLMSDELFTEDVYANLQMSEDLFIVNDREGNLKQTGRITRENDIIGNLNLLTVCLASSFKEYATLCEAKESPIYVKEIASTTHRIPANPVQDCEPFANYVSETNQDNWYSWNENGIRTDRPEKHKFLDIYVEGIQNITFLRNSKSSVTIYCNRLARINGSELDVGGYIIKFGEIDRSSNKGSEYFMHKSIVERVPNEERIMLDHIARFVGVN